MQNGEGGEIWVLFSSSLVRSAAAGIMGTDVTLKHQEFGCRREAKPPGGGGSAGREGTGSVCRLLQAGCWL